VSRSNKRIIIGVAGLLIFFLGWGRLFYFDGPYKGKVIDMETKKPLEGTAVVAVWWQDSFGAAHSIESVYEAREALTDQEGNFSIATLWMASINPLSKIRKPVFYIFKPGYAAYGGWSISPISLPENIRLDKKWWHTTVELRRLRTRKERSKNLSNIYISICTPELPEGLRNVSRFCVPREKIPNFIRLKEAELENM